MDKRFDVHDSPRSIRAVGLAETPLFTQAWRALRTLGQRHAAERAAQTSEIQTLIEALASIAEEAFRLKKGADGETNTLADPARGVVRRDMSAGAAERIDKALAEAGLETLAPAGEPYSARLMELLESVAQIRRAGIEHPIVAEVVAPAILYRGGVLRMGKAVIALPEA